MIKAKYIQLLLALLFGDITTIVYTHTLYAIQKIFFSRYNKDRLSKKGNKFVF